MVLGDCSRLYRLQRERYDRPDHRYEPDGHGTELCLRRQRQDSKLTCNNKKCSYEYDAIGQLIRVNDEKDTQGHSTGTTWVYEYDNGGNILARKRYVYTDSEVRPANFAKCNGKLPAEKNWH